METGVIAALKAPHHPNPEFFPQLHWSRPDAIGVSLPLSGVEQGRL